MVFKLHGYQRKLVDEARKEIANGSKGVLIQSPPGSGKSVVIAEIAKLTVNNGGRVLFIVHRKELIEQITKTFKQHEIDMDKVTINTVIKTRNRLGTFPEPTIIITDETHHSRAKTYREVYDYFPKAFRLGFTATPWRMSGRGFTDIYDSMVSGKSVQWLIDNHNLAPFKYYSVELADLDKLKKSSTGDYTYKSMDEAVGQAVYGDAVEHYKKLADGKQAILYAHSVQASKDIAETFNQHGVKATHADAKTPRVERERIMQDFRDGKIKVLCNVDLISEGFDVPDCSVVILMRPTASLVLHIQQSMRGMRYQPGKEAIIIDHVANYERHGLPTTKHEWTLNDREIQTAATPREDTIPIKECTNCFGVVESKETKCPLCGHEFPVEENEIEQVDAELKEIDQFTFETDYILNKEVSDLTTVEEHLRYADAKGYNRLWVKHRIPKFKHMTRPQFFMAIKKYQK